MPHGVSGKDKGTQLLRKSGNVSCIWQLNRSFSLLDLVPMICLARLFLPTWNQCFSRRPLSVLLIVEASSPRTSGSQGGLYKYLVNKSSK